MKKLFLLSLMHLSLYAAVDTDGTIIPDEIEVYNDTKRPVTVRGSTIAPGQRETFKINPRDPVGTLLIKQDGGEFIKTYRTRAQAMGKISTSEEREKGYVVNSYDGFQVKVSLAIFSGDNYVPTAPEKSGCCMVQ